MAFDPFRLTVLTDPVDIEYLMVFAVCVAGKRATVTWKKVQEMLASMEGSTPFQKIWRYRYEIEDKLRQVRMGQYRRISKALLMLTGSKVETWLTVTPHWLTVCFGPKTARFMMLYTGRATAVAVLDTHVLFWLRSRGHNVPAVTPGSWKKYKEVEDLFLQECDDLGLSPLELDQQIWRSRAKELPEK